MSSARLPKKGNWPARPSRARATIPSSMYGRGRCSPLRRQCRSRCIAAASQGMRYRSRSDGPEVRDRRRQPRRSHRRGHSSRGGGGRHGHHDRRRNEPPYERPPLSKAYLRGEAPFEKALVRPSAFYAEHGIETMLGTTRHADRHDQRVVELEDRGESHSTVCSLRRARVTGASRNAGR